MREHELAGDPGAAPDRTRLAWQRSGFAVLGSVIGVARFVAEDPAHPAVTVTLVALVAAAVALIALPTALARARGRHHERSRDLRAFAATTTLTAAVSLVLALMAPGAWR